MSLFSKILLAFAALILGLMLISLIPSDMWLVRTIDLVREPLSYLALLLLVISLIAGSSLRWVTAAMLTLALAINVYRVWPYMPVAVTEIALAENGASNDRCFTAVSANVKVKNSDYDRLIDQLRRYDPDVVFLMETDQAWVRELEGFLAQYPHVDRHPQPEAFGLVFASRIPVAKSNIVENTHRDTPTLYATLQPANGAQVEFIGLHPKPPLPGWDTDLRDQNIVNAGVQTPDRLPDAIVMGDFNDVPWSRTTTQFREQGDWRDPRVGRGTYPTFPSDLLMLGWPLDQIMVKGRLELDAFEVMPANGSDHRAVWARLCASG
ncbi:endonuclease/exonuclease/phosphatase family protein [Qipengyuania nanhaisediminis]|uniref:endonuclease/exonuclease/phosphatase family protein n=1 Tax=Qipengyuania nanhaisediminis TaxID=604088 RepID=UPI0038B341BB